MRSDQKSTKVKGLFCAQSFTTYLQSKGYSPATCLSYVAMTQRFSRWLAQEGLEAEQVTYNDVLAYIKYLKNKGNARHTIGQYINSVKLYFRALIKEGIIKENPASYINLQSKRPEKLYHILKPVELDYIYQNYKPDDLRSKVVLGLLIYQGLTTGELRRLEVNHVNVTTGMLTVEEGRRNNCRTLELKPHQAITLHSYLQDERLEHLNGCKDNNIIERLIITTYENGIGYLLVKLLKTLKQEYQQLESFNQVRASVITRWVKQYNLREAQYRAGHRYVSSTEKYRENDIETLEDKLKQYRPQVIPTDSGGN